MNTNNDNHESTTPVDYTRSNPYLIHESNIPPPPPPEYYMRQRTGKAWKVAIPVVLLLFGLVLGVLVYPTINELYHHSVAASPTPFVPFANPASQTHTPIPTPTPQGQITPTATTNVYDAAAIMQDLMQAGLQTSNLQYGTPACGTKLKGLQSEACWRDPTMCNLQCDEDSIWLGVFDTPQDAQLNYQQWVQSSGPVPQVILSGHCVVAGNGMYGTYAKIIAYDCQ